MAAISTWYNNQYSTWNRTRRLHAQPYLARTDTTTSRRAAEMAQQANTVVINMGDSASPDTTSEAKSDTLFGPNIGIVSGGPEWTERLDKTAADELTPEIIKTWVSRSKEGLPATTTLQALVNLKRPTLRLTPLEIAPSDDPEHVDSHHHHGLEFEYDCDAPKCGISVHALLSSRHGLAGKSDTSGLSKFLLFESVVEGGFGKILKLEDGATLELERLELHPNSARKDTGGESAPTPDAEAQHAAEDTHAKGRKRFTHFNLRKRNHRSAAAGPALAVVDAEVPAATSEGGDAKNEDKESEVGVRVVIRLAALDEEGKELHSVNEQVTYLHVVRFGPTLTAAVETETVEDKRPWVVKVVKREATIGPHTFHLHEIYGLSANSTTATHTTTPTSPAAVDQHVYPPAPTLDHTTHEEEPSSECLLCLSSPREVVLLPCRHLVACRECAVNMIEFGAGGTIVQQEEPSTIPATETPVAENAATTPAPNATSPSADGPPPSSEAAAPQPAPRRKRKAKGWFCPVCRQPYTSMLRITTTPPSKDGMDKERDSMSETHVDVVPAMPAAAPAVRGSLASITRPGFLRGFGRSGVPQPDVERGQVQAA
ncbi:uncharacterized protein FIBRA_05416 [Fibroporia radiculosa]|uniref:RING-type domain-containing protein n=1 Tax=Fibroporia radiculosa TaxID=599839 RepID=J4G9C2_9APHY|nr:uncharacterized protein FIBRA_05416 [Fibroporia radiculosa]CCM03288.1 predicted protein [Fibroporia radiculosa]